MIVKKDKIFETNSLFPNADWYNEGNYAIDETKEENQGLIQKIKDNAPYMELIIENEQIVDIIPRPDLIPEPEPVMPVPTIEKRLEIAENTILDLMTIISMGGM